MIQLLRVSVYISQITNKGNKENYRIVFSKVQASDAGGNLYTVHTLTEI